MAVRCALSIGSVVTFEVAWVISMHLVTWVRAGGELALAISLLSWYYHPMTKSTKKW
jgi:hypothetical protein